VEGNGRCLFKSLRGETEKNYLRQDSKSPGRNSIPGRPEYEAGVLTVGLLRWVYFHVVVVVVV
jgi:hypothetical protein